MRSVVSTALVLVLGVTASTMAFFLAANSVRHSDQLLLREDATQASLLLGSLLGSDTTATTGLSDGVTATAVDGAIWQAHARAATKASGTSTIALLHEAAGALTVAASVGTVHATIDSGALLRAVSSGSLPYVVAVTAGSSRWAAQVYQAPELPTGYFLYSETPVFTQPFPLSSLPGHPFSNVEAAIYMGSESPQNLLLSTTSALPLAGERAVTVVDRSSTFATSPVTLTTQVGSVTKDGSLILVMRADGHLSGSSAGLLSWVLLAGGSAVSVVVAGVFLLSDRQRRRAVHFVTELEERNNELDAAIALRQRSDARFAAMVRTSSDLTTVVTTEGAVLYQSPASMHLLGESPDDMVGRAFTTLLHPDDLRAWQRVISQVTQHPEIEGTAEWRLLTTAGDYVPVESHVTNLLDNEAVSGIMLNSRDVSDRTRLEVELRHQAFHDSLTGLANRALFQDRLEHALARLPRSDGTLAVVFLDLDDFKTVNDARGHGVGDDLLQAVSGRLRNTVRAADTLARLGGDEFAVLVEGADAQSAQELARRILDALRVPFAIAGGETSVGASIGLVVPADAANTVQEVLRNADIAMYAAKSAGKGRCEVFHPGLHEQVINRLQFETDLSRALSNNELAVQYQPIVDLATERVVGVEALMRWRNPRRGLVMPGEFIPVAESTGLIIPMGRWLLHRACIDTRTLQEQCERFDLHLAVNLSACQLVDPQLVDDVKSALEISGLTPGLLTLEITESVFMSNPEQSLALIERLKLLGVKLSIDDFGTGYSSLAYLQRIPVDELKIDRTFVAVESSSPEAGALVQTIVRLARDFGLETVAEGIETEDQLNRLRDAGCDSAQGYLFAKPVDLAQLPDFVISGGRHPVDAGRSETST